MMGTGVAAVRDQPRQQGYQRWCCLPDYSSSRPSKSVTNGPWGFCLHLNSWYLPCRSWGRQESGEGKKYAQRAPFKQVRSVSFVERFPTWYILANFSQVSQNCFNTPRRGFFASETDRSYGCSPRTQHGPVRYAIRPAKSPGSRLLIAKK